MRWFLLSFVVIACGGSTLGGPCQQTCDCIQTNSPSSCAGEWVCNMNQTCEYTCQPTCMGQVNTCPSDTDCNGSICSARKLCTP